MILIPISPPIPANKLPSSNCQYWYVVLSIIIAMGRTTKFVYGGKLRHIHVYAADFLRGWYGMTTLTIYYAVLVTR